MTLSAGLLLGGAVAIGADPATSATAAEDKGGLDLSGERSSLLSADTTALAPGLDLTSFQRLLVDGEQTNDDQVEAARTAVGVNQDGTVFYEVRCHES